MAGFACGSLYAAQPPETNRDGTTARLAEAPALHKARVMLEPTAQTLRVMLSDLYLRTATRFGSAATRFGTLQPHTSLTESLDALPVVGALRRRAGRRFNMDDGSNDDFAICYRLSSRVGLQVVPGGAPPVQLAAKSMASSAGLAAGMTLRLSRR